MLGQLQVAGNTTALAHYLDLPAGAGMLAGLSNHAKQVVRRRGGLPGEGELIPVLAPASTGDRLPGE